VLGRLVAAMAQQAPGKPPQQRRRERRAVDALLVLTALRWLGVSIRKQSEFEIWHRAFPGDLPALAQQQALLASAARVSSFVLNPILGAFSDAWGRKPIMLLSPLFQGATALLVVWRPTVMMLAVRAFFMPLSKNAWHDGRSAALADMFKDDRTAFGHAKAKIQTGTQALSVISPMLGSWLGAWDLRLPWCIAAAIHAVQLILAAVYLRETIPAAERRPFQPRVAGNPLSFLKLFRRGRQLRLLAINRMWTMLVGPGSKHIINVHRQSVLGARSSAPPPPPAYALQAAPNCSKFTRLHWVVDCGCWAGQLRSGWSWEARFLRQLVLRARIVDSWPDHGRLFPGRWLFCGPF
jgi:MFS family permease